MAAGVLFQRQGFNKAALDVLREGGGVYCLDQRLEGGRPSTWIDEMAGRIPRGGVQGSCGGDLSPKRSQEVWIDIHEARRRVLISVYTAGKVSVRRAG